MRRMEPGAGSAVSQLRRGTLEFCVLALLRDRERYVLELTRDLARNPILAISEGTLYPLLSRLRSRGWVTTSWQESSTGPPRRYYGLSAEGRRALAEFEPEWKTFRDAVDVALHGGNP